jgi:hypothetical protein
VEVAEVAEGDEEFEGARFEGAGDSGGVADEVTVTVTVKKPPQQRHENPPQNPTKRVLQLDQAVRYVNVLKPRATVQQNGERRGSWLEQPPSAAPR